MAHASCALDCRQGLRRRAYGAEDLVEMQSHCIQRQPGLVDRPRMGEEVIDARNDQVFHANAVEAKLFCKGVAFVPQRIELCGDDERRGKDREIRGEDRRGQRLLPTTDVRNVAVREDAR